MPNPLKTLLSFPHFQLSLQTNDRVIHDLIVKRFTKEKFPSARKRTLILKLILQRVAFEGIPRSRYDCFKDFALFFNRWAEYDDKSQGFEKSRIVFDVGPRTIKSVIEPSRNSVHTYFATSGEYNKDLFFDLIFFRPLKCLLQIKGLYLFHASCVSREGRAILLSGPSGAGKSTLALALMQGGFNYFADDEVILFKKEGAVECASFSTQVKIPRRSLPLFKKECRVVSSATAKKDKVTVDVRKRPSFQTQDTVRPYLLLFPQYSKEKRAKVFPLKKQRAIMQLTKEEFERIRFSGPQVNRLHFLMLASLLREVRCFRLLYNDQNLREVPNLIKTL